MATVERLAPGNPDNMQWQTVEDAKAKDKVEHKTCREMKKPAEAS